MKNIDNRIANALGRAGENIEMLTVDSTGKDLYQKAANGDLVRVNDMTEKEVEKIVEKVVTNTVTKYVDREVTKYVYTYDPSYIDNIVVGNPSSLEGSKENPIGRIVYLDSTNTSPAQTYSDLLSGKSANSLGVLLNMLRAVSANEHTIVIKSDYSYLSNNTTENLDTSGAYVIDSAVGKIWLTSNVSQSALKDGSVNTKKKITKKMYYPYTTGVGDNNTSSSIITGINNTLSSSSNSYYPTIFKVTSGGALTLTGVVLETTSETYGIPTVLVANNRASYGVVLNASSSPIRISGDVFLVGYYPFCYGSFRSVDTTGILHLITNIVTMSSSDDTVTFSGSRVLFGSYITSNHRLAYFNNSILQKVNITVNGVAYTNREENYIFANSTSGNGNIFLELTKTGIKYVNIAIPNKGTVSNGYGDSLTVVNTMPSSTTNPPPSLIKGSNIMIENISVPYIYCANNSGNGNVPKSYNASGYVYSETAGTIQAGSRQYTLLAGTVTNNKGNISLPS